MEVVPLAAGGALWLAVIWRRVRSIMGRTAGKGQYEVRETSQSLVADVGGYAAELLLAAAVVCVPSLWRPMIVPQLADALRELGAGQVGPGLTVVAAKAFGGLAAYLAIRFWVGNWKNRH